MVAAPVTSSYIRSSLLTGPKCAKISYKSPSGTHSPTLLTAETHRGDRSMMRQRHGAVRKGRACQFPKHLSGASGANAANKTFLLCNNQSDGPPAKGANNREHSPNGQPNYDADKDSLDQP